MIYVFKCPNPAHKKKNSFEVAIHHMPKKVVMQHPCSLPDCDWTAKRDFSQEIPTQAVIGATPISHSTSVKGSLAKEMEFVAGRFKRNPDGTVDKNHRPFRDTGEMNKFMNGQNQLGQPSIDQRTGKPRRRRDGSIIREGAKLFKYGNNAAPSRSDVRKGRREYPNAWTTESQVSDGHGAIPDMANRPRHHSPRRGR